MPSARRFVEHMTGIAPEPSDVDPDEAVALGAAVQAGILQGEVSDLMVMDQWQASLMRTLAQMQLRRDGAARERVEGAFDMAGLDDDGREEDGEVVDDGGDGNDGVADDGGGDGGADGFEAADEGAAPARGAGSKKKKKNKKGGKRR